MATTNVSSDISTSVNITARKNDSFFLEIAVTNSDDTPFSFDDYTDMIFTITNSNKTIVKKFTVGGTAATSTDDTFKPATITAVSVTGIIKIDVPATTLNTNTSVSHTNMNLLVGTYDYTFVLKGNTETHTIMHGKFKIVD